MPHATFRLLDEELAVLDSLATLRRGTRSSALREILTTWSPPEGLGPDIAAVRVAHRTLRKAINPTKD